MTTCIPATDLRPGDVIDGGWELPAFTVGTVYCGFEARHGERPYVDVYPATSAGTDVRTRAPYRIPAGHMVEVEREDG
jgi:hypothetical protein